LISRRRAPRVCACSPERNPPPGKGEVQISVKALGLNRAESMFRRGEYIEQPDFPARIGYEAAGTVAAVGRGGEGFKVGDPVCGELLFFHRNQ
jgi:NADPH:quinone reductase-like Zn-dependent oxidoreductase